MKTKILYCSLCISIIVIVILCQCIETREPVCMRVHVEDIDRTKDIVPNEEIAKKIVELYFTKKEGGEDSPYNYNIQVKYDEEKYEWIIGYFIIQSEEHWVLDGDISFGVRRDNGMVTY